MTDYSELRHSPASWPAEFLHSSHGSLAARVAAASGRVLPSVYSAGGSAPRHDEMQHHVQQDDLPHPGAFAHPLSAEPGVLRHACYCPGDKTAQILLC